MKIIKVDNFKRVEVSDVLICAYVTEPYGKIMVESLNSKLSGVHSEDYFILVEDEEPLYEYEYDLQLHMTR